MPIQAGAATTSYSWVQTQASVIKSCYAN